MNLPTGLVFAIILFCRHNYQEGLSSPQPHDRNVHVHVFRCSIEMGVFL